MLGAKPWVYAAAILGLVIAVSGVAAVSYRAGQNSVIASQARATQKHEAQVRQIEKASRAATQTSGHEIEAQRHDRDIETERARAVLEPVRVCYSPRPAMPRAPEPAAAIDSPAPADQLPVPAGRADTAAADLHDIGPGLIALMRECQRDHDDARAWRAWWAAQSALR